MRYIYITLLSVLVVSCSQSKMLQSSLAKYNSSIDYLHDSPLLSCPSTDSVALIINNSPLDSGTTVSKMRGLVLPFIFFNYFESNMKVKLGQSSLHENYTDFFLSAFDEESKRTACFGMTRKVPNDSTYTLELNFDTCTTYSKYSKRVMFMYLVIAYSWSVSESGSPAETNMQVSAKLKKAGKMIFEKTYPIKRTQPFVQGNTQKLRSDFVSNMVESLSLSTKQCIEEIITDINNTFHRNGEPVTANTSAVLNQTSTSITNTNISTEVIIKTPENKNSITVKSMNGEFNIGDKIMFYNFSTNSYIKATVKEIKEKMLIVEYESFGKIKTKELNKTDIKKI